MSRNLKKRPSRPTPPETRMRFRVHVLAATLAIGSLSAWLAAGPQLRGVDDETLRRAGSGDDWLTYGLTQGETRYSPLSDINAGNVKRLGVAWSTDIGVGG